MSGNLWKNSCQSRLIPTPRKIVWNDGNGACRVVDGLPVTVRIGTPPEDAAQMASAAFRKFWDVTPQVTVEPATEPLPEHAEGYRATVEPDRVTLEARTPAGLRYALSTLRQLAEPARDGTAAHLLPTGQIADAPALDFRAIHLCVFPETPMASLEKQIRLAAYHKFNAVILESWGVFPFVSHPEFGWADRKKPAAEWRRLLTAARDCGMTAIPQFNIFGHASMSRVGTGKHAILDNHPELETLFEPGGWCWCLSNPETRRVLTDLVLELYEFFGHPPYFHLGCDEADGFPGCRSCAAADPAELIAAHLRYFHDLLTVRNCRSILWHDMLAERGDPRWRGCVANGKPELRGLLEKLPRDLIVADWEYSPAPISEPFPEWPTARYLQQCGFPVAVCPWLDRTGIAQLGAMAAKRGLFGYIETTWHRTSGYDFESMHAYAPQAAWTGGAPLPDAPVAVTVAAHLRDVSRDMDAEFPVRYDAAGHTARQIPEPTVQS